MITQDVRLGGYADATEVTQTEATGVLIQPIHFVQNMETYTLDKTIEREYLLGNLNWTTDLSDGTVLASMSFPKVLFDIPYIADKIKGFRYFIGAVRVSVRITSNKFCYGKLIMAYDPMNNLNTGNNMSTPQRMSGNPHVLISADASEVVVFDIPFVSNKRALDIISYAPAEIALVNIVILNKLTDIMGNVNKASVQVTAQFIESKLFFPHDQNYVLTKTLPLDRMVLHSGRRAVKRGSVSSTQMQEAVSKSQAHVVSSAQEQMDAAVGRSGIMDIVESIGSVANTAVAVMSAASMLGLSKPSTLARTDVVQVQPMQGYANGKGIDYSVKMGMSNENSIGTAPVVGGRPQDEMNLLEVVQTPMLLCTLYFAADTPATAIAPVGPQVDAGGPWKYTYVDWVSDLFSFVSGSYKFKIYITASQMQAVRGVFFFTDDAIAEQDWRNSYHRVVDISGDTEVDFTLPYAFQEAMKRTSNQGKFTLWFKILNWSVPDPVVTAPIALNIYKSGCRDFQFGQLMERSYTKPVAATTVKFSPDDLVDMELHSNPREDFKVDFAPLHESMNGYQHDGLLMGEQFTSLREVVHKYTPYFTATNAFNTPVYAPLPDASHSLGLELIGQLYRFWRGSIRFNYIKGNATKNFALVVKDANAVETKFVHTAAFATNMNPAIEAEIPYWDSQYFRSTGSNSDITVYVCGTGNFFMSKAAGDDFSFHFLKCPDARTTNATINNWGFSGLQNFFNTES